MARRKTHRPYLTIRSFRYARNELARQRVLHRAVMPLPTARRPQATSVERSGDGTRGCRTRRLYLLHDGQHFGREGIGTCFVRRRTLGLSLGQIGAVAQLRAGRFWRRGLRGCGRKSGCVPSRLGI